MNRSLPPSASHRRSLAAALRSHQEELSRRLYDAVRDPSCANWAIPQTFEEVQEWGRSQLAIAMDLLTAWFASGDPLYKELFAGWIHSRLAADLSEEGVPGDYRPGKALELAKGSWKAALQSRVSAEAVEILEADLEQIQAGLEKAPLRRLRILFIGDCLQFEIMTTLAAPCVQVQIAFDPVLINERVQPVLRNRIRTLSADEFDLVFFSPFSHSYLPEYEVLLKPQSCFWPASKIAGHVDRMLQEVCATVDTLAARFQCPIYVHNTAGTVQSFSKWPGLAKSLVSGRNRGIARKLINDGLARYRKNPLLESRVHHIDEDGLRAHTSESELGCVYLNSYSFHPTRLGIELGRGPYFAAVYAAAFLTGKKVVVCDLDNTLWNGVIGEGPVEHFAERQIVLKGLRQRGVVLAINSKNDPRNIHWSGATLQAEDFVAARINWDPKVANMGAIRDELNLKLKDFVFIDDRPDELWRMQNAFPEIVTLDATQPATWNFLSYWLMTLSPSQEEDRTRLYQEKARREEFVNHLAQASEAMEDEAAALTALELSVKIEEASGQGLKRAAELINRTSQFNLCGSRTTVAELEEGLGARHWVITARAEDRFGSMGVVGVMRVDLMPGRIEIPIFVLSCRAFGFGIEYALLNSVRKLVPADFAIIGHYQETKLNQPCRKLYPESGMIWNGASWTGRVVELPRDPAWLRIENEITAKPLTEQQAAGK